MRVGIVHNTIAGHGDVLHEELLAAVRDAGHQPLSHSGKDNRDLDRLAADPGDVVLIAGGDGTVAKIAKRLAGSHVPIAIAPLGTANNIATGLGISGPFRALIAALASAERRRFDLGVMTTPGGEVRFLESVGGGLFAAGMKHIDRKHQRSRPQFASREHRKAWAVAHLRDFLQAMQPGQWRLQLDGRDLSGRYLLVEVLNMPCIGPNLRLAGEVNASDGLLDVVLVGEEDRPQMEQHLEQLLRSDGESLVAAGHHARAANVTLDLQEQHLHVDDSLWPLDESRVSQRVELRTLPRALTFVCP